MSCILSGLSHRACRLSGMSHYSLPKNHQLVSSSPLSCAAIGEGVGRGGALVPEGDARITSRTGVWSFEERELVTRRERATSPGYGPVRGARTEEGRCDPAAFFL